MTTAENIQNTANLVVEGGVTVTAIAFFQQSVIEMIPFLIIAVPLILLDADWGIKAARHRKERIRFSKAIRKTFGKAVEYICWCVLAATMSLAFQAKWIEYGVLGVVYVNELASIVGNYLECKDIDFSLVDLWKVLVRKLAGKAGVDVSKEEADAIIKEKAAKKKKG